MDELNNFGGDSEEKGAEDDEKKKDEEFNHNDALDSVAD